MIIVINSEINAQINKQKNIGGNMKTKTIPEKIDIKVNEPIFLTLSMPITGKIENCKPKQSWIIPKTGTWVTSGIIAPVKSMEQDMIAKKTMSLIFNLLKIAFFFLAEYFSNFSKESFFAASVFSIKVSINS